MFYNIPARNRIFLFLNSNVFLISTILSVLILLCVIFFCSGCTSQPTSLIENIPQETATQSIITPTFTITPRPISTQTPEVNYPIFPTATKVVPTPILGRQYKLTDWTIVKAEKLIADLENFPETLSRFDRGYIDSGYYLAYRYAGFAQSEAAYRFPNAEQSNLWKWESIFNQIQANQKTGDKLSRLISQSLKQDRDSINDIEAWFAQNQPKLKIKVYSMQPLAGFETSTILQISSDVDSGVAGAIFILLLHKNNEYSAYPLESDRDFYYGIGDVTFGLQDLTGDNISEAVIQHIDVGSFGMHTGTLDIFDLGQTPPKRLELVPQISDLEIAKWQPLFKSQRISGVTFQIPNVLSYDCERNLGGPNETGQGPTWTYIWDGKNFIIDQLILPSYANMLKYPGCSDILISSELLYYSSLNNSPAITELKRIISSFPFETKDVLFNRPLQINDQDELRYIFGLQLAYFGDVIGAREQMQAILVDHDKFPNFWDASAQIVLNTYHSKADLFHTCLATKNCYDRYHFGIDKLVSIISADQLLDSINLLKQMGVDIQYWGTFDFDSDGILEIWFLEGDPYQNLYILYKSDNSIRYHEEIVSIERGTYSIHFDYLPPMKGIYAILMSVGGELTDSHRFYFAKENSQKMILNEDDIQKQLDQIAEGIFTEKISIETARLNLEELHAKVSECFYGNWWWCDSDAKLDYMVGLVYELSNNKATAATAYRQVWEAYPYSPFAIMAMAKLEIVP